MSVIGAIPFAGPLGKIGFLSIMLMIVVIPTRLSTGGLRSGPRRVVSYYLATCVGYYVMLRIVLPRLG